MLRHWGDLGPLAPCCLSPFCAIGWKQSRAACQWPWIFELRYDYNLHM
jgi:hypothetical protein